MDYESAPSETDHQPNLTIEQTPERLGFIEPEEMRAVKAELIEAIKARDSERGPVLVTEWQTRGEEVVDASQDREHCLLGYSLAFALIWKEAGRPGVYVDELEDGLIAQLAQARYNRYPEITPLLEAEFSLAKQLASEQRNQ